MASGSRGQEMIRPIDKDGDDPCTKHPREVLRIFCEKCYLLICILCSYGEHKGHDTVLAADKSADVLRDLKRCDPQLEKKKKEALTEASRGKSRRDQIKKDFEDAKKKYEADMLRVKKEISKAEDDASDMESLQKEVKKLDSSSTMGTMLNLRQKITAVLGQTLTKGIDVAGLRATLKSLVPTTPRSVIRRSRDQAGDVAVPIKFFRDCRDFINARTDTPPAPPHWPATVVPLRWFDDAETEIAFIPSSAAAQLLKVTGGWAELTHDAFHGYSALMGAGGKAKYVTIWVDEGCGSSAKELGAYMMPVSMELGRAAREVTGRPPRRLSDGIDKENVSLSMKCEEWRKKFRYGHVHVYY